MMESATISLFTEQQRWEQRWPISSTAEMEEGREDLEVEARMKELINLNEGVFVKKKRTHLSQTDTTNMF